MDFKNLLSKANAMNWVFVLVGIVLLFWMGSVDAATSGDMSLPFFVTIGAVAAIVWGVWNMIKSKT